MHWMMYEQLCIPVVPREFNKNLVRPRTNTEVAGFKKKQKGKKAAAAADDNMGMQHTSSQWLLLIFCSSSDWVQCKLVQTSTAVCNLDVQLVGNMMAHGPSCLT